jgi:hypothetical protein
MDASARRVTAIIQELDRLQIVLNEASAEVRAALATGSPPAVSAALARVVVIDATIGNLADEWGAIAQDHRRDEHAA